MKTVLDPDTIEQDITPYLTPEEAVNLQVMIQDLKLPQLSLQEFVSLAWGIIEPHVPYKDNWHIGAICEHLEAVTWGQITNLIINIPPRHMKSILVACMWQPWVWSFRPETHWLCYSYSKTYATRDNVRSRRIVRSPFYQEAFKDMFKLAGDQNLKTRYENDQGGHREALGVGGSTGEGGDFLVGDDLLAIDDRHSETIRERTNEFWGTTVASRKNTEKTGTVIICQRLHERDIVGFLGEKADEGAPSYELLKMPAEFEGERFHSIIGWKDPRVKEGDLLWPDRFSITHMNELKRTLGTEQTAAQLQQRPSPITGEIFKKYQWKFWYPGYMDQPPHPVRVRLEDGSSIDCAVEPLPVNLEMQAQSWDMAFKELASSSFVVGQTWGRDGGNAYLLDQVRQKMDLPKTLAAVISLTEKWPSAGAKYVEDKANGPAVMQLLRNKIPGLIAVEPQGTKIARANTVSPFIESGNVYLPHPTIAPWVWDVIEETAGFPNAANDDIVDALTQALIKLFVLTDKKKRAGTWGRR
jgi:predicted phage terminase large subunit-like protein